MIVRIVLAVDRPALRKQLRRMLARSDVLIETARSKQRLWRSISRVTADLVVVSRSLVPDPPPDLLGIAREYPDAPGVVVLSEGDDPADRAELLAVGFETVLQADLPPESLQNVLWTVLERRRQYARRGLDTRRPLAQPKLSDFVSASPVMRAFMSTVRRVVDANVPLLLLGETGVGKERLARAIHAESPRAAGPFVAVNCGALPESLLESELFGHEEGAFTGAIRSRRGCFELAHGGTLFLDEIGEVPHHLQVKLLRVLQEGEVQRVGGEQTINVEVRIMAATNRDLAEEVEQRRFRRDLFYRLGVVTLTIPPLRERREDIPELVESYVEHLRPRIGCEVYGITADALEALCQYSWPGNVRELINVIERAMLLCDGDEITLLDLRGTLGERAAPSVLPDILLAAGRDRAGMPEDWLKRPWREVRSAVLEQLERAYLAGLLEATGGRIGETARRAGIEPRSLFDKMKRYSLQKEHFRPPRRGD